MGLAFFFYDVAYLLLATLCYGGAAWAGVRAFTALGPVLPWPLAVFPALVCGLLVLIAEVGALTALCPRLVPGRHRLLKGPVFYSWVVRQLLRRLLFVPGLKWLLFTSHTLRFLALRALGAKVAYTANMSNDVELVDPALLTLGPGSTLGSRCYLAGHFIENQKLYLAEVKVGAGALVGMQVLLGPGVELGANVLVKTGAELGLQTQVAEGAIIGVKAAIDSFVVIGARAQIATGAYVPPRTKIADDAWFPERPAVPRS